MINDPHDVPPLLEITPQEKELDLLKLIRCGHADRTGGNDYLLCNVCGVMWDYRREGPKDAVERAITDQLAALTERAEQAVKDRDKWKLDRDAWHASYEAEFDAKVRTEGEMQKWRKSAEAAEARAEQFEDAARILEAKWSGVVIELNQANDRIATLTAGQGSGRSRPPGERGGEPEAETS